MFEQLSRAIGWRVMELQSDGKKAAHAGLKGKNNPKLKALRDF